jgi:hypothetical protein
MTPVPLDRPPAREAGPELLVLQKWEAFCGWLLPHTNRWPKSLRFTLTQRVQNHALDVTELLVVARYLPRQRAATLANINLLLERMRFLLRLARDTNVESAKDFERSLCGVDEAGRMIHGWREALR